MSDVKQQPEEKDKFIVPVRQDDEKKSTFWRQMLAVTAAVVMSAATGCATGYSAVLLPQLRDHMHTDIALLSWIASITALPLFFGSMLAGWLMEHFGRRQASLIPLVPFVVGWVIIAFSNSVWPILLGRFITGLCQGTLAPSYTIFVGEISTPKYRGVMLTSVSLALTFGILLSHILGTYLDWKLTAVFCAMLPAIAFLILIFVKESPYWLAEKGRVEECKIAYIWYRGIAPEAMEELNKLLSREKTKANGKQSFMQQLRTNMPKPEFRKPLLIMAIFFITSQFSGLTVVCYYTTLVMEPLVGDKFNNYSAMLVIDVLRCIAMIIACFILTRIGRRPLTMISGGWTAISLFFIAGYLYSVRIGKMTPSPALAISLMSFYIVISHVGIALLCWTMVGEIFPSALRGLGSGICIMVSSTAAFVTVKTALQMFSDIGMDGTFLFYGLATAIGTVYLYFYLPETKGKTLLDVEESFKTANCKESSENVTFS